MRDREAQFRSWAAWPGAPAKDGRLRRAIARKAEGQAHVWSSRAAVPHLLREIGAGQTTDGFEPDRDARTPPRQRRISHGTRGLAVAGPPTGLARPHSRESPEGEY